MPESWAGKRERGRGNGGGGKKGERARTNELAEGRVGRRSSRTTGKDLNRAAGGCLRGVQCEEGREGEEGTRVGGGGGGGVGGKGRGGRRIT